MDRIWKLTKPLKLLNAAIDQHLLDFQGKTSGISINREELDAVRTRYSLAFYNPDFDTFSLADMHIGVIQLRELDDAITELRFTGVPEWVVEKLQEKPTIPDAETAKLEALATMSETVISKVLEDLKNDGLFMEFAAGRATTNKVLSDFRGNMYVELSRLNELRAINSQRFDLSKLIALCDELNRCYSNESFLSVTILVRAILDHVPPIFACKSFAEIANNYSGGSKSFKQCMSHLENSSRKIADGYLHGQIRNKESLPNRTQVNFSSDLDLLLAEVVRVLS